jgi:hypothetical protein
MKSLAELCSVYVMTPLVLQYLSHLATFQNGCILAKCEEAAAAVGLAVGRYSLDPSGPEREGASSWKKGGRGGGGGKKLNLLPAEDVRWETRTAAPSLGVFTQTRSQSPRSMLHWKNVL